MYVVKLEVLLFFMLLKTSKYFLSKITPSTLLRIIKLSISLSGNDLSKGTTTILEVVTAK